MSLPPLRRAFLPILHPRRQACNPPRFEPFARPAPLPQHALSTQAHSASQTSIPIDRPTAGRPPKKTTKKAKIIEGVNMWGSQSLNTTWAYLDTLREPQGLSRETKDKTPSSPIPDASSVPADSPEPVEIATAPRNWTREEIRLLLSERAKGTLVPGLMPLFPGRTRIAIESRIKILQRRPEMLKGESEELMKGLRMVRKWTKEDDELLVSMRKQGVMYKDILPLMPEKGTVPALRKRFISLRNAAAKEQKLEDFRTVWLETTEVAADQKPEDVKVKRGRGRPKSATLKPVKTGPVKRGRPPKSVK